MLHRARVAALRITRLPRTSSRVTTAGTRTGSSSFGLSAEITGGYRQRNAPQRFPLLPPGQAEQTEFPAKKDRIIPSNSRQMLFPRSHAWTRRQKRLIVGSAVVALAKAFGVADLESR
jgi:hypothetical protein